MIIALRWPITIVRRRRLCMRVRDLRGRLDSTTVGLFSSSDLGGVDDDVDDDEGCQSRIMASVRDVKTIRSTTGLAVMWPQCTSLLHRFPDSGPHDLCSISLHPRPVGNDLIKKNAEISSASR